MSNPEMKPCPFCGMQPDMDEPDTLYPTGTYWRVSDFLDEGVPMRHYVGRKEYNPETDHPCYSMHCVGIAGGCDAEVHGDSMQEAIDKWNRRA